MAAVKPLTVFADAQATAAAVLRDALAARTETYAAAVEVRTRVPTNRSTETPHLPLVVVRKDTDIPHPSMANARVTLRITAWHQDPDQAHDLAMLCQGLLLIHSGPVIRGVRVGTGPLPAMDDQSEVDLSTFTVLANVKPTVLA